MVVDNAITQMEESEAQEVSAIADLVSFEAFSFIGIIRWPSSPIIASQKVLLWRNIQGTVRFVKKPFSFCRNVSDFSMLSLYFHVRLT